MKVIELKGNQQVLTQTDGKTFRIDPRETKEISKSLISNEFKIAEKMGLIMLTTVPVPTKKTKK